METPENGLIREIKEELNLDISIVGRMEPYSHDYPDFSIRLIKSFTDYFTPFTDVNLIHATSGLCCPIFRHSFGEK